METASGGGASGEQRADAGAQEWAGVSIRELMVERALVDELRRRRMPVGEGAASAPAPDLVPEARVLACGQRACR